MGEFATIAGGAAVPERRQDRPRPGLFEHSSLEPEAQARLRHLIRQVELAKGESAVLEGQKDPGLLTVASGVLKLYKELHDGRRQITGFRFSGDLLTWSLPGRCAEVSVQAVTDAVLCHVDSHRFREFSAAHPAIGCLFQDLAAAESAKLQAHMLTLGRKAPMEKMASFLLEMLRCNSGIGQGDDQVNLPQVNLPQVNLPQVYLPMTRNDIADYLGLETETTSRIFTRLKEEGILALPRPNRVLVQDWPALERLASGGAMRPFKAACGT